MARQLRIEFPDATYHCTAQAPKGQAISVDQVDHQAYEKLLEDLIGRTGWLLLAWILLEDRYHIIIRTPEANLVAGMKWFQNAWTKRFNTRHKRAGVLFRDRYKSILVQPDGHLSALIDYIHLYPYRNGLIPNGAGLASYRSSSLSDYLSPVAVRRPWIAVANGMAHLGYQHETDEGRLQYLLQLERIVQELHGYPTLPGGNYRSLRSTLQSGWYLGSETFHAELLDRIELIKHPKDESPTNQSNCQNGYHGITMAWLLLEKGLTLEDIKESDLATMKKGDWRKRAIGRAIRKCTTVPTSWISENLKMGAISRVGPMISKDPDKTWGREWKNAILLMEQLMACCCNAKPSLPYQALPNK